MLERSTKYCSIKGTVDFPNHPQTVQTSKSTPKKIKAQKSNITFLRILGRLNGCFFNNYPIRKKLGTFLFLLKICYEWWHLWGRTSLHGGARSVKPAPVMERPDDDDTGMIFRWFPRWWGRVSEFFWRSASFEISQKFGGRVFGYSWPRRMLDQFVVFVKHDHSMNFVKLAKVVESFRASWQISW